MVAKRYDRPFKDKEQRYVYVWRLLGTVLWVGQGRGLRGVPRPVRSSNAGRPEKLVEVVLKTWKLIKVEFFPCASAEAAIALETEKILSLHPRYNSKSVHGGFKGMHSPEGLESIRKAQTGKVVSPETRQKLSETSTGRVVSEETRRKQSEARKGKPREDVRLRMLGNQNLLGHKHTEETKSKISESLTGRSPSELCRQRARERMIERNKTNPPRRGKKCSEEHKRKVSEARKKRR